MQFFSVMPAAMVVAFVVFLLAFSVMSLAQMDTTFQVQVTPPNSLYVTALALPSSAYHSVLYYRSSASVAQWSRLWLVVELVAHLLVVGFTLPSAHCIITALHEMDARLVLVNPGNWRPGAIVHLVLVLLATVLSMAAVVVIVLILSRAPDERVVAKQRERPPQPQPTQPASSTIILAGYHLAQLTAVAVLLLEVFLPLGWYGIPVWQQTDSPHVCLYLAIALIYPLEELRGLRWRTLSVVMLALGLSMSIAHFYYEVERVADQATWLNPTSIHSLFNGTESAVFNGLYRYTRVGSPFIDAFAALSGSIHEIHCVTVSLGTVLFVATGAVLIKECR